MTTFQYTKTTRELRAHSAGLAGETFACETPLELAWWLHGFAREVSECRS